MTTHDAGRGHERARELAALRADEFLAPQDEAWLADHLDFCDPCAAIAAEYDAQHDLFTDLRAWTPEPPRDLWARTAAAIEAERDHGAKAPGWGFRGRSQRSARRLSLAPVAAVVAVVVVVGAGLLNTVPLGIGGGAAGPTPIALTAAADIQVIGRDSQGNVEIRSRPVDSVCPVGVSTCGAQPTFAVTSVSGVESATTLQGLISPSGHNMVVVAKDAAGEGVWVAPLKAAATPTKSAPPAATPSPVPATPSPKPSQSASIGTTASAASGSPIESAATPTGSPVASSSPATTAPVAASNSPDASVIPSPSGSAAASSSATPSPSPAAASPTTAPSPLPSVEVTPAPDAAIKIASGVTVVGAPIYAPDGVHLAFAAMPSNGSAGPDIYVWTTGDKTAQAITSDHNTWLAAWTANGILVSRVASGTPATFLLDADTGHATAVGDPGIWLPALSPDGTSAAWWDGTVKLASDGVTWVPDAGKIVAGDWPVASGAAVQVLAKGPLAAWQVRWADDGGAVAVWTAADKDSGKLTLYRVDPVAKTADLANPMLDATPANPDFSLRAGRLAWTTPTQGVPQVVEVLAWSGKSIGRLEVPADGSGTVVP